MVQADKKLKREELGVKEHRTSKVKFTEGRKARPVKEKVPEHKKVNYLSEYPAASFPPQQISFDHSLCLLFHVESFLCYRS